MNPKGLLGKASLGFGILAAIALLLIIGFVVVHQRTEAERQRAIVQVLNENVREAKAATYVFKRYGQLGHPQFVTNFLVTQYAAAIGKIQTSRCPQKFRLAWLDYVQTCQREFAEGILGAAIRDLAFKTEYVLGVKAMSADATKDALARMDRNNVAEARRRLEMVALEYGVGR